jgi:hypothetical protein
VGFTIAQSEEATNELPASGMGGSMEGDRCVALVAANMASDTKQEIIRRFMGGTSRSYLLRCPPARLSNPNADTPM